jgi:hypothetical protein
MICPIKIGGEDSKYFFIFHISVPAKKHSLQTAMRGV